MIFTCPCKCPHTKDLSFNLFECLSIFLIAAKHCNAVDNNSHGSNISIKHNSIYWNHNNQYSNPWPLTQSIA